MPDGAEHHAALTWIGAERARLEADANRIREQLEALAGIGVAIARYRALCSADAGCCYVEAPPARDDAPGGTGDAPGGTGGVPPARTASPGGGSAHTAYAPGGALGADEGDVSQIPTHL
jgi:hypothetical protein